MPLAEPTHTISACLLLLWAEHVARGITTFWQQQSFLRACRVCPGMTGWLLIQTGSSYFIPWDCVALPLDQAVLPVTTIIIKIHILCTRQLFDLGKPRARPSQGNSNSDKLFPASVRVLVRPHFFHQKFAPFPVSVSTRAVWGISKGHRVTFKSRLNPPVPDMHP